MARGMPLARYTDVDTEGESGEDDEIEALDAKTVTGWDTMPWGDLGNEDDVLVAGTYKRGITGSLEFLKQFVNADIANDPFIWSADWDTRKFALGNLRVEQFVTLLYQLTPYPKLQYCLLKSLTADPEAEMGNAADCTTKVMYGNSTMRVVPFNDAREPVDFLIHQHFPNSSWRSQVQRKCFAGDKVAFEVVISPAVHLFNCNNLENQCYLVKALCDVGSDSDLMGTVAGRALVEQAWQGVETQYYCKMILEAVYLYFLAMVGWALRLGFAPNSLTRWVLLALSFLSALVVFSEMFQVRSMYGVWQVKLKWAQGQVKILSLEIFSFASIVFFISMTEDHQPCIAKDCVIYKHVVLLVFVVLIRWMYFMINLLATSSIGEHLLPAYHAMTDIRSITFVAYVMLAVFACYMAYYMFPIEENMPGAPTRDLQQEYDAGGFSALFTGSNNHILFMFMKVFRLTVMGDFDLWELEGLDPIIQVTDSNFTVGTEVGVIDDPMQQRSALFHFGIRSFFMAAVLFVNIMLMNVYIGLLSEIYGEFSMRKKQLVTEFRAMVGWRLMLQKMVFFCCLRKATNDEDNGSGENEPGQYNLSSEGVWIAYQPLLVFDDATKPLQADEIQNHQIYDPSGNLRKVVQGNVVKKVTCCRLTLK